MITQLKVNNWKSYSEATLYIDPLTFVIGTNASGKSNLLDALVCLSELSAGKAVEEVIGGLRGGSEWLIRKGYENASLAVEIEDAESIAYYEVEFRRVKNGVEICGETLKTKERELFSAKVTEDKSPVIAGSFYTGKRGNRKKLDLGRSVSVLAQVEALSELKEVKEYSSVVVRNLKGIFMLNPIPNNMRVYSQLSQVLKQDASNVAGVLAGLDDERRKEVEEEITKYLKRLPERDINRIWTEKVGVFETDAMLYCEEEWSPKFRNVVDARGMSDGTLRFLAIVMALLTIRSGSLLIVEEVDNGLHPSRVVELVQMLKTIGKERKVDVLCTTHNPVVIDGLGIEMMPFIAYIRRDVEGGSVVRLVEEKDNLAKMLSTDSIGGLMIKDLL